MNDPKPDSMYGGHSMVDTLRRVVVRRPDRAFGDADPELWHYTSQPKLDTALTEHAELVSILQTAGAEVIFHDAIQDGLVDAIFTHDSTLITDSGAIVLRMGKHLRQGEEQAMAQLLKSLDVPIIGSITEPGCAECGDMFWLDRSTLAVGVGFRTNQEGVRQLSEMLEPQRIAVEVFQLPYFTGPDSCLHLLSLLSMLDNDLAVVYPPLMPVALWQELVRRDIEMIEVPEQEFLRGMATNVLAVAPRRCVMLQGNPVTEERLRKAGCEVRTYPGQEISLKAEGGATCLTRPILRTAE